MAISKWFRAILFPDNTPDASRSVGSLALVGVRFTSAEVPLVHGMKVFPTAEVPLLQSQPRLLRAPVPLALFAQ